MNKTTISYKGVKDGSGWIRNGIAGHVIELPGGFLVTSMSDRPLRIFVSEAEAVQWVNDNLVPKPK